jgi:integrase
VTSLRQTALRDLRVSAVTANRYAEHVLRLTEFWARVGLAPRTFDELDAAVAEFLEELWADGGASTTARYIVAGVQHFVPGARRGLELSWSLTRTWGRLEPPTRAVPLSCTLVLALAARACERGWMDVGTMLLVGFEAMLRTGELFNLAASDVMFMERGAVIRLVSTKMGVRQGRSEMVQLHCPMVVDLLHSHVRSLAAGARLSARTPQQLRGCLRDLVGDFSLSHVRYTWYSLRRGGATADFLEHGSMETTIVRGRWATGRTARLYVEQAVADSVTAVLDRSQADRISGYASRWSARGPTGPLISTA